MLTSLIFLMLAGQMASVLVMVAMIFSAKDLIREIDEAKGCLAKMKRDMQLAKTMYNVAPTDI